MAYTTIDDGSKYFQTLLYSGNATGSRALTNTGNSDLQPDWVWIKERSSTSAHKLLDSTRGVSLALGTNTTNADESFAFLSSFDSDGFTIGTSDGSTNASGDTYVAWQWKANGGTTTSQTGSDIDSVTQANTTSKFAIITYTGASNADSDSDNNSGAYWRVKHGLGSTPKLAIFKKRSSAAAWYVWHHKLGGTQDQKYLQLQGTNAVATESDILFGNTDWSSTEFEIGGWDVVNRDSSTYVAYMFDEVQGYSKLATYTGNANDDGPFLYTGFKPKFAIFKASSAAGEGWAIRDSARDPFNQMSGKLSANVNAQEGTTADDNDCDFLSNGIKLRSNDNQMNKTGTTFVYIAFAEHPFVSSKGVPVTAR